MSLDLAPDLMTLLTGMQATINGLDAKLSAVHAEMRARPASPPTPRKSYSVEEVAELLGRRPYTVREWCRHGQITAVKRAERRGGAALWSVSAEEVGRYRDEGLLEIDPERNNVN